MRARSRVLAALAAVATLAAPSATAIAGAAPRQSGHAVLARANDWSFSTGTVATERFSKSSGGLDITYRCDLPRLERAARIVVVQPGGNVHGSFSATCDGVTRTVRNLGAIPSSTPLIVEAQALRPSTRIAATLTVSGRP
jgi:hypothetical protein